MSGSYTCTVTGSAIVPYSGGGCGVAGGVIGWVLISTGFYNCGVELYMYSAMCRVMNLYFVV